MPHSVLFYRERDEIPVLDWYDGLEALAQERLRRQLGRLSEEGHHARRPLVENLGSGIYELRTRLGNVNYRILFSFFGRSAVILTCGYTKEREIPRTRSAAPSNGYRSSWPIQPTTMRSLTYEDQ